MAKNRYHNKIKNAGLIFECLVRQTTSAILNGDDKNKALNIIRKGFNTHRELGKEFMLYNAILNSKTMSDKRANYFVTEILKRRCTLDQRTLKREKYNVIREIKDTFDLSKIMSSKVKDYKVYASVYKLFEHYDALSPAEQTESYFNVIEFLTTDKSIDNSSLQSSLNEKFNNDKDLAHLTNKLILDKFNSKYANFSKNQKNLLKAYISGVSNENSLKEYIIKILPSLKKTLRSQYKLVDNKIVRIKLNEAIKSINKFCLLDKKRKHVNDKTVIQIMRYYELSDELKRVAK